VQVGQVVLHESGKRLGVGDFRRDNRNSPRRQRKRWGGHFNGSGLQASVNLPKRFIGTSVDLSGIILVPSACRRII
jgi:hypothetical protein